MMKHEFERIAKMEVTNEQYEAIEKLYMASSLAKHEFIKTIKCMLKSLIRPVEKRVVTISIPDNSGYYETPNGCWHHLIDAEVVGESECDIATGKISKLQLRKIKGSYRLGYSYDYRDYEIDFVA